MGRRPSESSNNQERESILRVEEEPSSNANEDLESKKPATKMRSSIACSRCRRSKIKCLNSGTDTQCRACATAGRECSYPPPPQGHTVAKRAEVAGAVRNDGEADVKRQRKRESDSGKKNSVRNAEDPFESPQMTAKLWKEVYSIFMLHCSTELPFLHEELFHTQVQQPPEERSSDTQTFLLAMLALTARFIPELASAHHLNDPRVASEYYADAFAARLDASSLTKEPSLERVQGLLMISLYHWLMCRGQVAWMYITVAKGFAQTMGLMFEEDIRTTKRTHPASLLEEARQLGVRSKLSDSGPRSDEQWLIQREIKRRTAYSCFILDRFQASGRCRPQNISIEDLHVQLPCSEEDFQFGINVTTSTLMDQLASPTNAEGSNAVASTQVLSIFIRLCEIWGRVSRWSSNGGRRNERHAPWESHSDFHKLWSQVADFRENLPPKLKFSTRNISAHIAGQTITLYTSIQTLMSLCTIVLHREYIPFIPLRCSKPEGPLDEPTFPPGSAPEGFWEESAKHIFRSARGIMEIVRITSERQVLVESPQLGFAVWAAAFAGIYSLSFPYMDQERYMCGPDGGNVEAAAGLDYPNGATALAVRTLNDMRKRSKMACGWALWCIRMNDYYQGIKRDYDQAIKSLDGPSSEHQKRVEDLKQRSLREGGYGGGLEEYRLLERELKDFGPSLEQDRYNSPTPVSVGSTRPPNVKMENAAANWAAVNNVAPGLTAQANTGRLGELSDAAFGGQGQGLPDPRNSGTYYARLSPTNPSSLLAGSTTRSRDVNSPFHNRSLSAAGLEKNAYGQSTPAAYGHQGQSQAGYAVHQRQQSQDQAFKQLEQINMQGVDVTMFGGSLDGKNFPAGDWQSVVGPTGQGGGMNFMEAAARPSGAYGASA